MRLTEEEASELDSSTALVQHDLGSSLYNWTYDSEGFYFYREYGVGGRDEQLSPVFSSSEELLVWLNGFLMGANLFQEEFTMKGKWW